MPAYRVVWKGKFIDRDRVFGSLKEAREFAKANGGRVFQTHRKRRKL